jgi:hypothetical protein
MKKRRSFYLWSGEFIGVTAIAVILSLSISFFWIAIPVIELILLKIYEHYTIRGEYYMNIRRQLEILEALLPSQTGDIRCTYHIPIKRIFGKPKKLLQAFDYVPRGGGGGRKFLLDKGIIGVTFRKGGVRVENFQDREEFRREMIDKYGYTKEEMGERSSDRRSYMCYSIVEGNSSKVLGLLYFDSREVGTFSPDEKNEIYKMISIGDETIKSSIT